MADRKRRSRAAAHRDLPLRRGRAPKVDRLGPGRRPAMLRRLREAMRANLESADPTDAAERALLHAARLAASADSADAAERALLHAARFVASADSADPSDAAEGEERDQAVADELGETDAAADGSPAASPELGMPAAGDDGLPEYTLYRDGGCHVAPACLSCPLATCIYDRKLSPEQQARRRRNRRIRDLARKGWSSALLAERFKLSPAQVRRIRGPRRRKDNT